MSLAPGVRLGVYEVVALVGAGGMGEVYRARDPRLGRDVAIKVLPPAFSTDIERLRRFEQEARVAAALNHPNILAVFDIGSHDGAPYVVSELLEGETLRDRLRRSREGSAVDTTFDQGPLPVRKAIEYAVQIARGLAAAHGKGIVHRDLKPENVFVTDDGRVKILDFGLAKLTEREPALAGLSAMATTPPDTLPGVVLGTIGYMAPEQVRGLPADHRSDIFSFGTILYELLSGQRAFRGATSADTMTAILKDDPQDLPTAERHLPPALARIVDRCVEKDAAARFQTASDLAFALEALSAHSGVTEAIPGSVAAPKKRDRIAWTLVALLSVLSVGALAWAAVAQFWRAPIEKRVMRFSVPPPEGWSLPAVVRQTGDQVSGRAPVAMSPDGRRIAYIARAAEKDALWIRSLDTLSSQMLPGTEGVSAPFWSPDGRFVGFFADGKLKKIDVSGGPPIPVCDASAGAGGSWSRDGVILYADSGVTAVRTQGVVPIFRVAAGGGVPTVATTIQPGDANHTKPVFLPDGRHFLYSVIGQRAMPVYLASLDAEARTKLIDVDSANVSYSNGHVLFLRGATLMAQPFDVKRLALAGDPFPVAEPIQTQLFSGITTGIFSASDTGVLVYQTGSALVAGAQLAWFDRAGKQTDTLGDRGGYADVELSPDGKHASITVTSSGASTADVWLIDLARGIRTRLTVDPAADNSAIWSADGARLVFFSNRKGLGDLYQRSSNGGGAETVLLEDGHLKLPFSISTDGKTLLYSSASPGGQRAGAAPSATPELWGLPLTGDPKPFVFLKSQFALSQARFSPDGPWVAYVSPESGQPEVYVTPFPGPGGRTQVSTTGGTTRDGAATARRSSTSTPRRPTPGSSPRP